MKINIRFFQTLTFFGFVGNYPKLIINYLSFTLFSKGKRYCIISFFLKINKCLLIQSRETVFFFFCYYWLQCRKNLHRAVNYNKVSLKFLQCVKLNKTFNVWVKCIKKKKTVNIELINYTYIQRSSVRRLKINNVRPYVWTNFIDK